MSYPSTDWRSIMSAEVDESGNTSYPNETEEQRKDRERREAAGQGQPAETEKSVEAEAQERANKRRSGGDAE